MANPTPTPEQRVHTWHVCTVSLPRDGLTVWVRRLEYFDTPVKATWHESTESFGLSITPEGESSAVDVEIPVVEVHSWRYALEADLPPITPPPPPPASEGISLPFAVFWGMDETDAAATKVDAVAGVGLILQRGTGAIAAGLHGNALRFTGDNVSQEWQASDEHLLHAAGASFSLLAWFKVVSAGQPSSQGGPGFDYLPYDGGLWFRCGANSVLPHSARVAPQSGSDDSAFDPAVGAWHLLHLFYDAAAQRFGWSLDGGTETVWPTAVDMPATTGAGGILDFVTGFPGPDGEVLIDDVGLISAGKLPAADVTWLYNSGQGRAWPINVVRS
jgi:hypothetical protein